MQLACLIILANMLYIQKLDQRTPTLTLSLSTYKTFGCNYIYTPTIVMVYHVKHPEKAAPEAHVVGEVGACSHTLKVKQAIDNALCVLRG